MREEIEKVRSGSRRVMGRRIALVICLMLALVAYLVPMVMRQKIKSNLTWSNNELRQIGISLFEFESEYGRFPDSVTAEEIKRKTGTPLTLSDRTSNDVFVQLIAAGIMPDEGPFYTHSGSSRKPDGDWSSDATALVHGETGFAFISGLSSKDNPSSPIVFGPVKPGTRTLDVKSFGGKAVILKLDQSVIVAPIDSAGRIMIAGFDLLDPQNPIWNGKMPDVKWPK